MSYTAPSVANKLLNLAEVANRPLTQIDIQKLVYFAHGWYLALQKQPLIDETILAWKYGPVVRSLYDEFREFGSNPITAKAKEWQTQRRKRVRV